MSNTDDYWDGPEIGEGEITGNGVINHLNNARANQEDVTIKYFGGSNEGAERTITPITLFHHPTDNQKSYVRAHCYSRNENRTFKVDLIEIEGVNKVDSKKMSRNRYRNSRSHSGSEAARRHIREAEQF